MIAPLIFVFDQVTKWLVVRHIPFGGRIAVWEHFIDLVHTKNRGAAFGFLSQWESANRDIFFYLLSLAALVFLFYYLKEIPAGQKGPVIPIAFIFGGALGNLSDRIFRGAVVDFLSVHWHDREVFWEFFGHQIRFYLTWPAFNVADSAITVGVIWLMMTTAFHTKKD